VGEIEAFIRNMHERLPPIMQLQTLLVVANFISLATLSLLRRSDRSYCCIADFHGGPHHLDAGCPVIPENG